jgi:methyl-accepting chemotaxis protein
MLDIEGIKNRCGIGVRISLICGINVLVLLAAGCFMLLRFEYSLTQFFANEYIRKVEGTMEEQGEKQRNLLRGRCRVNAEIAAGIAAPFVYNLDDRGINLALQRYMELDEMLAIRVTDVDGVPFFAVWKGSGDVNSGVVIPDSLAVDSGFSAAAESYVHDEKVGSVEVYFTDELLAAQAAAARLKARQEIEDFTATVNRRIEKAFVGQIISVLGVIMVLVVSIVASMHLFVLKPMKKCVRLAQSMSEGDFSEKLDVERNDEIGTLAETLGTTAVNLGRVLGSITEGVEKLNASSEGLLATSRELSSGADELKGQAESAAAATERIKDNILLVTDTAETMFEQSRGIAAAAREMSSDVNSVAAAIEEMSASIREVARNCSGAQVMAGKAQKASRRAEEQMTELDRAVRDIGKIVFVIENITEQIKLLALNATIEAARSGEAGRGFTVVADEVKELAQQTALAAHDIARQIGGIQERTGSVVSDIRNVADINSGFKDHTNLIAAAVEQQNATASEITRIIVGVAENSGNVSDLVGSLSRNIEQEVVSALKEANGEAARVSANNREVNSVARDTARAAGNINSAAGELSRLAGELQEQVKRFKTG